LSSELSLDYQKSLFILQNELDMVFHANLFAPLRCDLPSPPKSSE